MISFLLFQLRFPHCGYCSQWAQGNYLQARKALLQPPTLQSVCGTRHPFSFILFSCVLPSSVHVKHQSRKRIIGFFLNICALLSQGMTVVYSWWIPTFCAKFHCESESGLRLKMTSRTSTTESFQQLSSMKWTETSNFTMSSTRPHKNEMLPPSVQKEHLHLKGVKTSLMLRRLLLLWLHSLALMLLINH